MTSMISLRPYQEEAIAAVLGARRRGINRQLIALPPAAGKTVIFVSLAQRIGGRVLVLAHRDELLGQAADKVHMLAPDLSTGIIQASRNELDANVLIASVPTLAQPHRLAMLPRDLTAVICDEAHHAAAKTWRTLIDELGAGEPGGPLLLGVTASPDRADGMGLQDIFGDEPVYEASLLDLIEQGFLCPLTAKRVHYKADFTHLRTSHGDITAASAERAYLDGGGPVAIAKAIHANAPERKHILVFAPGVASATATADVLTQAGIPAAVVHGDLPLAYRRDTLRRFSSGEFRALVNCALLTEGVDLPLIDCVILGRPTQSRALYLQMCGRGLRLHPEKADTLLLDMTANSSRLELVTPASLVGLSAGDVEHGESLSAAAARKKRQLQGLPASDLEVTIHTRNIDVFRQRQAMWVRAANGHYTLTCGKAGQIILRPEDAQGNHWSIIHHNAGTTEILRRGLTIDYATALGEAHSKQQGAAALINRNAKWMDDPATESQLWRLRKERIAIPAGGLTKGEASALISQASAAKVAMAQ